MELKFISREKIKDGLKNAGKLRIKVSHGALVTFSALMLILFIAFTVRMLPLQWEIQTNSLHLSEFDPYYQYSLTKYMVENSSYNIFAPYIAPGWTDTQRWYPGGINMGDSLSSLPMTAAIAYQIVTFLGVNMDLMSFCALIAPIMGTLSVLIVYFLGKDIGGKAVGMFAALFLALSASYIQRTALGFFDTEVVGVFSLVLFSLLFLRAIEEDRPIRSSVMYSLGAAAALAYFIMGWGAAYYLVDLIVVFVFALILLKRYTRRLFLAYNLTFGLGLLISIVNPVIATRYLTSFAVLPVAGMFVLLFLNEIIRNLTSVKGKILFAASFITALVGSFATLWTLGYMQSIAGKFLTVLDPFLREGNPLVESVAEHRLSAWGSVYYDLGIGIILFGVGLFFIARNLTTKNVFLIIFGLTSLYFASSMVRLLVIFAPALGITAGIGIVGIMKPFITLLKEPPKMTVKKKLGLEHVGKEFSGVAVFLIFIILMTNFAFSPQTGGLPKVIQQADTPVTITVGSLPTAPDKPVTEWFNALKYLNDFQNKSIVVCSWWDYGYWLTMLGNVTSLADNATINATQIENIGFTFMANETLAMKMLSYYNTEYILVFTTIQSSNGAWLGWGDEGKWNWMARISGNPDAQSRFINKMNIITEDYSWENETTFGNYSSSTSSWEWNDRGTNSTIYELMAYAKHRWIELHIGSGSDTSVWVQPKYFKEAYFAGLDNDGSRYGGYLPLVCLYELDWQQYYSDYPNG